MNNSKLKNIINNSLSTPQQPLNCSFAVRCLVLVCSLFIISTDAYEIVAAYNCGSHNNITTKYVKYTSDEMYEGLTSRMALKQSLPSSIVDQQDKKLLISQRASDYGGFSYFFKISGKQHFLIIFKFIEVIFFQKRQKFHNQTLQTSHKNKQQRILNIKVGDQIIHQVDIFAEAGYGNVLHKWIFFDLKDDIVYLNKTYPALNAYLFTKRLVKVTIEQVKGIPKTDAIILVKGADADKFLNDFISYQQSKNMIVREYISEKYHKIPQNNYRSMRGNQEFLVADRSIFSNITSDVLMRSIASLFTVFFLMFHQQIYIKFNLIKKQQSQNQKSSGQASGSDTQKQKQKDVKDLKKKQ